MEARFYTRTRGLTHLSQVLKQPDLTRDDYTSDGSEVRWVWDSSYNPRHDLFLIKMGLRQDVKVRQVGQAGIDGLICYKEVDHA